MGAWIDMPWNGFYGSVSGLAMVSQISSACTTLFERDNYT